MREASRGFWGRVNNLEDVYKRQPENRRNPEGGIIEVLGHKDKAGIDVLSIIRQFNLPEDVYKRQHLVHLQVLLRR